MAYIQRSHRILNIISLLYSQTQSLVMKKKSDQILFESKECYSAEGDLLMKFDIIQRAQFLKEMFTFDEQAHENLKINFSTALMQKNQSLLEEKKKLFLL